MEHYIELIDGTRIEAFLKAEQPEIIKDDNLKLDTTGEYLQVGRPKQKELSTAERNELNDQRKELFIRNAHRLIMESHCILTDSRMFLAPVPIRCGLAYTGTSGFDNITLGVYIEWWKYNECAWTEDDFGAKQPIYYIAGSPLSGGNKCAYVGAEGNSCSVSIYPFRPVWSSFIEVNNRYTAAKQRYEAYTIEEVVEKLFG